MVDIERLIEEYRQSDPDVDRGWLLRQLATSSTLVATAFLEEVLLNPGEQDYLRVEVLSGFRVRDWTGTAERDRFSQAVVHVLETDEDDVVRQHAAMALVNFAEAPGVLEALENVVSNTKEDDNLRYCALDSIQANASQPSFRAALVRLARLPDLGPEIAEDL